MVLFGGHGGPQLTSGLRLLSALMSALSTVTKQHCKVKHSLQHCMSFVM